MVISHSQKILQGKIVGRHGDGHLNRTNGERGGPRDPVKYPSQHSFVALPASGFSYPEEIDTAFPFSYLSAWSLVFSSSFRHSNPLDDHQQPDYSSHLHSSTAWFM